MEDDFIVACSKGDIIKVKYFLDNNYNFIDDFYEKCIQQLKYFIRISEYINIDYDIYTTGFEKACNNSQIETIKYMIEYGKNKYGSVYIHSCIKTHFPNICSSGQLDSIKYLIEYGKQNDNKIDIQAR